MNYNTRVHRQYSKPAKVNTFLVAIDNHDYSNVNLVHRALGAITYCGSYVWRTRTEHALQHVIDLLESFGVSQFTVTEIN